MHSKADQTNRSNQQICKKKTTISWTLVGCHVETTQKWRGNFREFNLSASGFLQFLIVSQCTTELRDRSEIRHTTRIHIENVNSIQTSFRSNGRKWEHVKRAEPWSLMRILLADFFRSFAVATFAIHISASEPRRFVYKSCRQSIYIYEALTKSAFVCQI